MKKPKQNIIPEKVVTEYKLFQNARKKKQTVILQGGRAYGKTLLRQLMSRDN